MSFQLARLGSEQRDFLLSITQSGESRKTLVSVAIAKLITDKLALPGTETNNPVLYFNNQFGVEIYNALSNLNEVAPINVDEIRDLAAKLYVTRHNVAFPQATCYVRGNDSAVADFFRISRTIDDATLKTIDEGGKRLMVIYNNYSEIVRTLGIVGFAKDDGNNQGVH